jgi:uncharacterized DUF497 family protein
VPISFDPAKKRRSIAERGIAFDHAENFQWDTTLVVEDLRKNYGERRFQALGLIAGRLHALVLPPRAGKVHVISLRKANRHETRHYETQSWNQEKDGREP